MTNEIKFLTIEQLMDIKSKYTIKACEENATNDITNDILWYASYAIIIYNEFGLTLKIEKKVKEFRKTVGELYLLLKRIEDKA